MTECDPPKRDTMSGFTPFNLHTAMEQNARATTFLILYKKRSLNIYIKGVPGDLTSNITLALTATNGWN